MVRFSMLALAVMSFCFVSPILKAEDAPTKTNPCTGVVKSVAEDGKSFVLTVGEKDMTIKVTADTKYVDGEGKEVKMADVVKEKANVKVTEKEGTAEKVEACKAKCCG